MPVSDLAASNISGVPYDEWPLGAGASKVAAVASNDGDTTYIQDGNSNHRQTFNVAWPATAPATGKVNSLTAKGYLKYVTAAWSGGVGCRNASGESTSNNALTTSYALYQHVCVRPGGGDWTAADLVNGVTWLQVRNYTTPGSGYVACTQLYFALDFEIAGGCVTLIFADLLSVLLPLLGAGLGLSQMAALSRELYRRTRTRLRPDEHVAALEALRSYRRPVYVL